MVSVQLSGCTHSSMAAIAPVEEQRMAGENLRNKRLIALFALGCLLFNYPLLSLFNLPRLVFGIPLLYAYLLLVWILLIVLMVLIVNLRSKIP